jgi:hypothetical protein
MRATFFVNAYLDTAYPEADIIGFIQQIVSRGHDVQFHSHEEFRCFRQCVGGRLACWQQCTKKESFIGGNSYERQLAILREGADNIERWSGRYPIAFRGGAFDADLTTLKALRALNIPIESSLNRPSHVLASAFERTCLLRSTTSIWISRALRWPS